MKDYTAQEQFAQFQLNGKILDENCFYFYDWFCKDHQLKKKAEALMKKAIVFAKLMDIDLEKTYVWFKNNCPCVGSLYDDFRFADKDSGNTIWTVAPSCGHRSTCGRAEVWGAVNGFEEPVLTSDDWSSLIADIACGKCQKQTSPKTN